MQPFVVTLKARFKSFGREKTRSAESIAGISEAPTVASLPTVDANQEPKSVEKVTPDAPTQPAVAHAARPLDVPTADKAQTVGTIERLSPVLPEAPDLALVQAPLEPKVAPKHLEKPKKKDYWQCAIDDLTEHDPSVSEQIATIREAAEASDEKDFALQLIRMTKQSEETLEKKKWTVKVAGREIVIRNHLDRILKIVTSLKDMVNPASNIDPVHIGLPLAALCVIMQYATNDQEAYTTMVASVEEIASLVRRYSAIEELYRSRAETKLSEEFESQLTSLYRSIIQYELHAARYYRRNTMSRFIRSIPKLDDLSDLLTTIRRRDQACKDISHVFNSQDAASYQKEVLETLSRVEKRLKPQDDFGFVKAAGFCLDAAPYLDPRFFVGRDETIALMAQNLQPEDSPSEHNRIVLGGMGGIGKTQLAAAYIRKHKAAYDSVLWLDATSENTLKQSIQGIAQRIFSPVAVDELDANLIVAHVLRWLTDSKNKNWLVILDNYDEPEKYRIERYFPFSGHGSIIITSRLPGSVNGYQIDIRPLDSVEEGLQILQTRSRRLDVTTDPYATRLVERLAGLPLALATAGSFLRQSSLSFEDYFNEYERVLNVNPDRPSQLAEYQDRTLYTTWDISYRHLQTHNVKAAEMLKLFAYFHNQNISFELVHVDVQDNRPQWFNDTVLEKFAFMRAMDILIDFCFVESQVLSSKSYFGLHSCVHDWTVASLNREFDEQRYWIAFDCVAQQLIHVDPTSLQKVEWNPLAMHANRLVIWRSAFLCLPITSSRLGSASTVAWLLRQQVLYTSSISLFCRVQACMEAIRGPEDISTIKTFHSLGVLYFDVRKLDDAEEMLQRALAGKTRVLGSGNESTLQSLNVLAVVYEIQDRYDEAEKIYCQALAAREKTLGLDDFHTLATVHNLGILYNTVGRYTEAEKMFDRALRGREKLIGLEHTSSIETRNCLGLLYMNQKKFSEAEATLKRALADAEKVLPPEHMSTLTSVGNLAILYRQQKKIDLAEKMSERVLAGFEKSLIPGHPWIFQAKTNLGKVYLDLGKLKEAEPLLMEAQTAFEKSSNEVAICEVSKNLAILNHRRGDCIQAQDLYKKALVRSQEKLGVRHPSTIESRDALLSFYTDMGKADEAQELIETMMKREDIEKNTA